MRGRGGIVVAAALALLLPGACNKKEKEEQAAKRAAALGEALAAERLRNTAEAAERLQEQEKSAALQMMEQARKLASMPELLEATRETSATARRERATLAFQRLAAQSSQTGADPDFVALLAADGTLVARTDVAEPDPGLLRDAAGKPIHPSIALVLDGEGDRAPAVVDHWQLPKLGLSAVAVEPVVDDDLGTVVGAVVLARMLDTAALSRKLGAEIVFYDADGVVDASMTGAAEVKQAIAELLGTGVRDETRENGSTGAARRDLAGTEYVVATVQMPEFSTSRFPDDYPAGNVGAVVLRSLRP